MQTERWSAQNILSNGSSELHAQSNAEARKLVADVMLRDSL